MVSGPGVRSEGVPVQCPQPSQENQRQGRERRPRFEADWKRQGQSGHSDDALGRERAINKRITKQQTDQVTSLQRSWQGLWHAGRDDAPGSHGNGEVGLRWKGMYPKYDAP